MKAFSFFAIILAFAACQGKDAKNIGGATSSNFDSITTVAARDTNTYTTIQWIDSVVDKGVMKSGGMEEIKFQFKNTGSYPLYVIAADPSCGCTVADYPKEAIAPGGTGTITAGFDTQNQHVGQIRKSINVTTNTKGEVRHTLIFTGEIVGEGESPKQETQPSPTKKKGQVIEQLVPDSPKKRQ